MISQLTYTLFILLSAVSFSSAGFENANDPTGVTLFMTAPACDSYKCVDVWPYGSTQLINWWLPPSGDVSVALAGIEKSNQDVTYEIVKSMPANTTPHCDSGKGIGKKVSGTKCGGLLVVVPKAWKEGNYTVVVTSLKNSSVQGYTDIVRITSVGETKPIPKKVEVETAPHASSFSSTSGSKATPAVKLVASTSSTSAATTTSDTTTSSSSVATSSADSSSGKSSPSSGSALDSTSTNGAISRMSKSGALGLLGFVVGMAIIF